MKQRFRWLCYLRIEKNGQRGAEKIQFALVWGAPASVSRITLAGEIQRKRLTYYE